jgi:hypothetical protein
MMRQNQRPAGVDDELVIGIITEAIYSRRCNGLIA